MRCACSSGGTGMRTRRRTSDGSWGWFPPPCNRCTRRTPIWVTRVCAVTHWAASMMVWLPLLPGWAGRRRGWLICESIAWVEGRAQGTRSSCRQRRSWPMPHFPSGVRGPHWWMRSWYFLSDWRGRVQEPLDDGINRCGGQHGFNSECWGDQDLSCLEARGVCF